MLTRTLQPIARLSLLFGLAITVAACQSKETAPQTQASRITSQPVTKATTFTLTGEGIEVIDNQTGELKALLFDSDSEQVSSAVTAVIGEPETNIPVQGQCPESTVWPTGFAIAIDKGKFVGWGLKDDDEASRIKLLEGISVGSTLAELEEHYGLTVRESSLETGFSTTDGFSGITNTGGPEGKITHLWSGNICIAEL